MKNAFLDGRLLRAWIEFIPGQNHVLCHDLIWYGGQWWLADGRRFDRLDGPGFPRATGVQDAYDHPIAPTFGDILTGLFRRRPESQQPFNPYALRDMADCCVARLKQQGETIRSISRREMRRAGFSAPMVRRYFDRAYQLALWKHSPL